MNRDEHRTKTVTREQLYQWEAAEHIEALEARIAELEKELQQFKDLYAISLQSQPAAATDDLPAHVCGLQGYDPMQDPPCPACVRKPPGVTDERELLKEIRADLLMRSEKDSQGLNVVNLSGGLWLKLCKFLQGEGE